MTFDESGRLDREPLRPEPAAVFVGDTKLSAFEVDVLAKQLEQAVREALSRTRRTP